MPEFLRNSHLKNALFLLRTVSYERVTPGVQQLEREPSSGLGVHALAKQRLLEREYVVAMLVSIQLNAFYSHEPNSLP